jgi:hypothetical protein
MKRLVLFMLILLAAAATYAQTVEDIQRLGLTETQLRVSFEKRHMVLKHVSTRKKKKIKEGAFAIIQLRSDTAMLSVMLEAFLSDTVIVSILTPRLHEGREIKLDFTAFKAIPIKDIAMIRYSVRDIRATQWTGRLIALVGAEMILIPVLIPALDDEASYSEPEVPFMIASGIVLYVIGRRIEKKLIPKEYHLGQDWNWSVVK